MNKQIKNELGNKEIFAKNLNRYLGLSGKTQTEVAKFVNVSKGTFSDWMSGRAYPRMDKVQLLAQYFGIQMSDLVDDENNNKKKKEGDQEILDLFHKVPEDKREFVLAMIRSVADNL